MADGDGSLQAARAQRLGLRAAMDEVERSIVAAATGRPAEWAEGVRRCLDRLLSVFDNHVDVILMDIFLPRMSGISSTT